MKLKLLILLMIVSVTACKQDKKPEQVAQQPFDEATEKAAIMKTIKTETDCFYKGDYECWKKQYIQADYSYQAWNNRDGSVDAQVGWQAVDNKVSSYLKEHPVTPGSSMHNDVQRKNMVVKFFTPELAFLAWDQLNGNGEKKVYTLSKEERIMEKQKGEWKIANVSAFWDYKNQLPADSVR